MNLRAIAQNIPDYPSFFTVDELFASTANLHQAYPDNMQVEKVGVSRQGDPMETIRIGSGSVQAVVIGGSHPNEPLGCMVIDYFTRLLCEDDALRESLDYTWHFIKCVDPDATRRNEGWFKAPFRIPKYFRHFFRPPLIMQPEFTFPYQYKGFEFDTPLPETKAIMAVFEQAQPDFFYSLHCGGYGGSFYDVSEPCEPLYKLLQDIRSWFDLHVLAHELIVEDVPGWPLLEDGIYQHVGTDWRIDDLEAKGVVNPASEIQHGGTGFDMAMKYGAFSLNAEVDYCQDARVADTSLTDVPLAEAMAQHSAFLNSIAALTPAVLPAINDFRLEFNRALVPHLNLPQPGNDAAATVEGMATVVQLIAHTELPQFVVMREIGQLLGMLDDEIADGNPSPHITSSQQLLTEQFDRVWKSVEDKLQYRVVPLRDLIGYQLCAGLAAAAYVRDQRQRK